MIIARQGIIAASKAAAVVQYDVNFYANLFTKFTELSCTTTLSDYSLFYSINDGVDQSLGTFDALGLNNTPCSLITTISVNAGSTVYYGAFGVTDNRPIRYDGSLLDCPNTNNKDYCGTGNSSGVGTAFSTTVNAITSMYITISDDGTCFVYCHA